MMTFPPLIYVAGHRGMVGSAIVTALTGDKAPALKVGDVVVQIDPRYFRPTEVETLLGDPSKAKAKLGWVPEITVQEMCTEMVAPDSIHVCWRS
jgi:GDPmannose 4,6-dehydratase